jgi:hypothetical protein
MVKQIKNNTFGAEKIIAKISNLISQIKINTCQKIQEKFHKLSVR